MLVIVLTYNCVLQVFPPLFVSTSGSGATYTCSFLSAVAGNEIIKIQWLVNGTLLDDLNLTISVETGFDSIGGGIGILILTGLPLEYNMTTIGCNGEFNTGRSVSTKIDSSLLLVQGDCVFS